MNIALECAGLAAAALTTGSFVPQVVRTWRTRDTRAISLPMYVMFTAGVALWLIYGIGIGSIAVTLSNGLTLVLSATILVLKFRYR